MIVMMAGLPGTGKSTLARALAERVRGVVLDKDVIRAALFGPAHVEYSMAQDDFCMEVMLEAAGYLVARDSGVCVLLDGRTFSRRYQRERVIEFSARVGTAWAMIECICAEETALVRVAGDRMHPAANRGAELYRVVRGRWEEIECPRLVVNTDGSLADCLGVALEYISSCATNSSTRTSP